LTPFAADAQARAVVDARRNLHGDLLLLAHAARAVAARARVLDHPPGTAALRTGASHGEEALRIADLPAAGASGAGHRLRAGLGAVAGADGAAHDARDGQRDVLAEHRLFEVERQVITKVVAAGGAIAAFAAAAEEVAEAEQVAEDVAEVGELIRVEPAHAGCASVAVTVVAGPLLLVGEHAVRFRRLLELLLGIGIAGVLVGVVLHRELAVGLLDVVHRRATLHAEDFVVITLFGSRHKQVMSDE
jgi:hypothetical protein